MKKEREVKILSLVALIVAVIGLSIAYAALSTTLVVKGASKMDSASWDIHFENLSGPIITSDAKEIKKPTLNATSITNFEVSLTKPGDKISYEFDVKNAGSLNAKIGSFSKQQMVCKSNTENEDQKQKDEKIACDNIVYELRYKDNNSLVKQDDELKKGKSRKMVLTIEYKSEADKIPSSFIDVQNLSIDIIYVQN